MTATSVETLIPLVRGGAGGAIAVGVMLSEATVRGTTRARLGFYSEITAANLTVLASDISVAKPVTNVGSVGRVAVSVAESEATLERTTIAVIPGSSQITLTQGNLTVLAISEATAYTSSRSDGGGGIAVSSLTIDSTIKGITRAEVDDTARIVVPTTNTTGDITVSAESHNLAIANTASYGGGGVNVQVSKPTAINRGITEALMGGDIVGLDSGESGARNLVVRSIGNDRAVSGSDTKGGGVIQVGVATVQATNDAIVNASIGGKVTVTNDVTVEAESRTDADATNDSAGGGAVNVSELKATVNNRPTIAATVEADAVVTPGNDFTLRSTHGVTVPTFPGLATALTADQQPSAADKLTAVNATGWRRRSRVGFRRHDHPEGAPECLDNRGRRCQGHGDSQHRHRLDERSQCVGDRR